MSKLTYFLFEDDEWYTTARSIDMYARSLGASVRIDPDGSKHPGSVCNGILRDIFKNRVTASSLGLSAYSCVSLIPHKNEAVITFLLKMEYIKKSELRDGTLDLYTRKTAEVICAYLLNDPDFVLPLVDVTPKYVPFKVFVAPKKLSLNKDRPVASVFNLMYDTKVIDTLSPEEQEAVRKYNALVRTTRKQGRKHTTRKSIKEK